MKDSQLCGGLFRDVESISKANNERFSTTGTTPTNPRKYIKGE